MSENTTTTVVQVPAWRAKAIAVVQIVSMIAATVGSADLISAIQIIPDVPNWISVWLAVVGTFLRFTAEPILVIIGDIADDGLKNDSFKIKSDNK